MIGNKSWEEILAFALTVIVVLAVIGTVGAVVFSVVMVAQEREVVLGDGNVVDLEIRPSGHWLGGDNYWVKLDDGKWYEIT